MSPLAAASGFARSIVLALAFLALPAWSQGVRVQEGERVTGVAPKSATSPYLLTSEEEMPARALRLVSPTAREMRSLEPRETAFKRVEIGFGREMADAAEDSAARPLVWQKVGPWRIAKVRVNSPGAQALRVGLRIGSTREPWELRVAGSADETKALGPLRLGGPLGREEIHWTPVTEGEGQVIEITSPASLPEPSVEIVMVSHLVAGPSDGFRKRVQEIGSSLSCNIDVKCVGNPTQAFYDVANATVHLVFTRRSGGTAMCSGTLLNDSIPGTQVPYLYTANHCFEQDSAPYNTAAQVQEVASTLNTYFFFDAVSCGSYATPPYKQLFGGATYLYHNLAQDVLFVRLNDWAPEGAFLAGWDATPFTVTNTPVIVLHHPYGDLKKFTAGVLSGTDLLDAPRTSPNGFWRTAYNQGVTEFGSSGGGLFTLANGRYYLRGSLSTGNIFQCSARLSNGYYVGNDWFTRFDVAFPAIRGWLQATGLPDFDVTDMWWKDSTESGWGINLTQHPSGQVFAVWYTYAADGGPLWLVMSGGTWTTSRTFTGTLYRTSGPAYSRLPFDPGQVKLNPVGSLTLNFTDADNATLTWVVDGVQGAKTIRRLAF